MADEKNMWGFNVQLHVFSPDGEKQVIFGRKEMLFQGV